MSKSTESRDGKKTLGYVLGAALGIGAAAALPATIAWLFLHPPRRLHHQNPRSALGIDYERVRLCTADDVTLSAWYVPAPPTVADATPRGVVVVCHGYHGNRATMLPYLEILHRAGYAAFLFDFRAHGWSGGRMATFGHREPLDLEAALDWIEAREELKNVPIALLGESMGASVALLVAAEEQRVRAVVADSPYARFDAAVNGRLQLAFGPVAPLVGPNTMRAGERILGIRCEEIAPVDAVCQIAPRPVLLIHGTDDPLVTPENSREIRDAAPGNVTLWEVEGSRHVRSVHDVGPEYARRVTSFLDDAFAISSSDMA